jgi:CRP-like cAMP-binding protein
MDELHISETERAHAFWRRTERYSPGSQISREDGSADRRVIILSGWACELRILADGRRQIFNFLLPGDPIEVRSRSNLGAREVVALTRLEVVNVAAALAADTGTRNRLMELNEASWKREERLYDHLVRVGRLTARERVVHLLLELCDRMEAVGLVKGDTFKIPLTQEVFADALGLSIVHINRTFKQLREGGWVSLKAGIVTLSNRDRLAALSCYQPQRDEPQLVAQRH